MSYLNSEFSKGFHPDDQDHHCRTSLYSSMIPRYPENGPFNIQGVLSAACQYFPVTASTIPKRPPQPLKDPSGRPQEAHAMAVRRRAYTPKCSERDDALAPEYLTCGPMRCMTSRPLLAVPGALPRCLTAPSEAGAFPSSSTPFDDHSRLPVASHPSPPITGTGDIHPLPLPLSLLKSLTPMTLSLVTGTAREPTATPSAACLGTTLTAVLLRKSTWAPVVSRLSTAGFSCPPPSPYRAMAADSTPLATQRDAPPHATGYSFEIVVVPAISTGLRNEEGFKALPLPKNHPLRLLYPLRRRHPCLLSAGPLNSDTRQAPRIKHSPSNSLDRFLKASSPLFSKSVRSSSRQLFLSERMMPPPPTRSRCSGS
ncbi:hypothetical protein EDB85DRAFT_335100 [Lactarius pseudohatsudake]|nr:hypothetical protein EDB85DRAFT_335100 [Lactarius pseudohatsudake]